jgi:hypothetical protein
MNATTHLETEIVTAMRSSRIGQSAAKRLIINCDMMKVQRLAERRRNQVIPKCGANVKRPLVDRFNEKVAKMESGCHEWQGCLMPNGYGQFHLNGKTAYAHRVAFEIHNGKEPVEFVLHTCDNRKCVNPEHLFVGSFYDNMDDMVSKQRQAHGERNSRHKLNATEVVAIRQEVGTHEKIAAKYGVSRTTISMIRSGKIWRYV